MAKFTDVVIDYVGNKVTCTPPLVKVYYAYPPGPDSVRWTVESFPDDAERVELKWETESPFRDCGMKLHDGKLVLLGTGNKSKSGTFKYSILFLDANGNVVAGLDPMVVDEPQP